MSLTNSNLHNRSPYCKPSGITTTMRFALFSPWIFHFALCIAVLTYGSTNNHDGRKYIPVDVNEVSQECERAFVNVFSSSIDDGGALICCHPDSNVSEICQPPPSYLLFSQRLARFPDAWLLPLFPVLLRILTSILTGGSSDGGSETQHTKRRLYFYITLIQLRGWILYLLFDTIEDMIVSSADSQCWYSYLLQAHYGKCQGRVMDYSDHVVLYFAQILPLALTEVVHSFAVPYYQTMNKNTPNSRAGTMSWFTSSPKLLPAILLIWLGNLYVITLLGAYNTAMFFHTGPEIFIGYLISLLLQIPLCLLQCTQIFPALTTYLFGNLAI